MWKCKTYFQIVAIVRAIARLETAIRLKAEQTTSAELIAVPQASSITQIPLPVVGVVPSVVVAVAVGSVVAAGVFLLLAASSSSIFF